MDGGIYQKWIEDIDALSEAQREEVQKILAGRSSEAEVIAALEGRLLADRVCPLCQRQGAVCRGSANGLRRFSCAGVARPSMRWRVRRWQTCITRDAGSTSPGR